MCRLTWRGALTRTQADTTGAPRPGPCAGAPRAAAGLGDSMERCGSLTAWAALFVLILTLAGASPAGAAPERPDADDGWVVMPAGGRPAYMGIHGGTMPVSLLVAGDGASLFTFVGRTGNDFLEALRATDMPLPSLLNATVARSRAVTGGAALFAGNATSSLPVIPLTGESFAALAEQPGKLTPFGLSDEPLSIEGRAARPKTLSPAKTYRLFVLPQYLEPRAGRRSR